jgi:hypothetical protein
LKTKLILGAMLTLVLAVTSVSLAFASGDSKGDNNGHKVRILHVTLKNSHETPLDLGTPGPSVATGSSCSATSSATTSGSARAVMSA